MRDDTTDERPDTDADPGTAIGRGERSTETIPGGIGPRDERVSALDTQSTGVGDPAERGQPEEPPSGHRQGSRATDDDVRRAGDRQ